MVKKGSGTIVTTVTATDTDQRLKRALAAAKQRVSELEHKYEQTQSRCDDLEDTLDDLDEQNQKLEEEARKLREQLQLRAKKIKLLTAQVEQLQAQGSAPPAALQQELEQARARLAEAQKQATDFKQRVIRREKEAKALKAQLEQLQGELAEKGRELEAARARGGPTDLKVLQQARDRAAQLEKELARAQDTEQILSQALEQAQQRVGEVEAERDGLQAQLSGPVAAAGLAEAQQEAEMLGERLKEARAQCGRLQVRHEAAMEQAGRLEAQLEQALTKPRQLEEELTRLQRDIQRLREERDQSRHQARQLDLELARNKTSAFELEQRLNQAERLAHASGTQAQRARELANLLADADRELAELRQRSAEMQGTQGKASEQLKETRRRVEELESELLRSNEQLSYAREQLSERELALKERETSAHEAARRLAELQEKLVELEAELEGERRARGAVDLARAADLEGQHAELTAQVERFEQERAELQAEIESLKDRVRQLEQDKLDIEAAFEELVAENSRSSALEKTNRELADHVRELEELHQQATEALETSHNEALATLKKQHEDDLAAAQRQHRESTAGLQGELNTAKTLVDRLQKLVDLAQDPDGLMRQARLSESELAEERGRARAAETLAVELRKALEGQMSGLDSQAAARELAVQQDRNAQLEADLAGTRAKLMHAHAAQEKLEQEVSDIKGAITRERGESLSRSQEVQVARLETVQQMYGLQEALAEKESQLQRLQTLFDQVEKTRDELRAQLSTSGQDLSTAQTRVQDLLESEKSLKTQLHLQQERNEAMKDKLRQREEDVEELTRERLFALANSVEARETLESIQTEVSVVFARAVLLMQNKLGDGGQPTLTELSERFREHTNLAERMRIVREALELGSL